MKRILIIDDEENLCFFLKKNLEMEGDFEVSTCSDSRKALERTKDFKPELILLDIQMPEISGP